MKVAIFILLKALEVGVFVFFPHYLGRLICKIKWIEWLRGELDDGPYWLMGFLFIIAATVIFLIVWENWRLAGTLIAKINR